MTRPFPVFAAVLLLAAALGQALPGLSAVLVYDRVGILQGELWRLVTGHLVHFSPEHFLGDALAVAMLVILAEHRGLRCSGVLVGVMAAVIGVGLLLFEPEMAYFGGLSGIAYGLGAYLALDGILRDERWRLLWVAALLLMLGKIGFELYQHDALRIAHKSDAYVPAPLSHALGIFAATLVFLLHQRRSSAATRNSAVPSI